MSLHKDGSNEAAANGRLTDSDQLAPKEDKQQNSLTQAQVYPARSLYSLVTNFHTLDGRA